MRRFLAIFMVLFFGLPTISPLFALTAQSESSLAACCRRDGKHHCMSMGKMNEMAVQGTSISAIPHCCERFPGAVGTSQHHDLTLDTASLAFAEIVSHPAIHRQTEARARVALDRSRRKRGPPAGTLS